MSPYKSRGLRSQWTEKNLQQALLAIQNGESKNSVSKRFNIPRRTLGRYERKNTNKKQTLGRKTVLSPENEAELVSRIIRLAEVGYPLTKRILRKCVFNYCEKTRLPHTFSQEKRLAGRYWLKAFLNRHPEITSRRAQNLNPARAQKLNRYIVKDYFDKLGKVLLEHDLMDKPERIYNVDEKGCRLTLHHQQSVLAKKGAKRVHLTAPEHGENVTVVSCGNASGVRIPPAILFKGQRLKPEWCDHLPPGTLTLMTKKGSMTVETFNEWLKHLGKYKLPGKCLLIFDGAACHLDTSIVETADTYDIILFCLPSNTTHELQPMDKPVFKAFEYYWDEQVLLYWTRHKERSITKQRFGKIFSLVWDKAVTPKNIASGFSATGIYPFNPEAISDLAFAPSTLTELPIEENCSEEGQLQKTSEHTRSLEINGREIFDKFKDTSLQPGPSGLCQRTNYQQGFIENTPPKQAKASRQQKPKKMQTLSISDTDSSSDNISLYSDTLSETFTSEEERRMEDKEKNTNKKEEITWEENAVRKGILEQLAQTENKQIKEDFNKQQNENAKLPEESSKETKEKEGHDISFTEMLETPYKEQVKKTNRKKAINSKALVVKRDVFNNEKIKKQQNREAEKNRNKNSVQTKLTRKNKDSWYCKLCHKDEQKDMRLCTVCFVYVHEECAGLAKNDKIKFVCPDCS